jgi:hypothetical protein
MAETPETHVFDAVADIEQALSDPHLIPLPAQDGPLGSMAWLRAAVARFSSGEVHAPRRAFVEAELRRVDPAVLRTLAAAGHGTDRRVVVLALAEGLGVVVGEDPDAFAEAVFTVADNYFGIVDGPAADAAVAFLLPRMTTGGVLAGTEADDPGWLELAANRIGLLVQACDATASLIGRSRAALGEANAGGMRVADAAASDALAQETATTKAHQAVAATLKADPPVAAMRRIAAADTTVGTTPVASGDLAVLNVGPVGLTFGTGPRVCPGRAHAIAIAEGALVRDPGGAAVGAMVGHVLTLAETWTAWDGTPIPRGDRVYTPHKAIRRVADHLIDHLAEVETRLAGRVPEPDHWHASMVTTPADLAPFTEEDLNEARSRLTRLAQIWQARFDSLDPLTLDASPGDGWSFREIAAHVAGSAYYADAVGKLG